MTFFAIAPRAVRGTYVRHFFFFFFSIFFICLNFFFFFFFFFFFQICSVGCSSFIVAFRCLFCTHLLFLRFLCLALLSPFTSLSRLAFTFVSFACSFFWSLVVERRLAFF